MALWPADRVRPASVNYSGEQQRPHIRQRNSSSRCLDAVFKGHRGQSSDKRDRVEVPGQPGLELFLAAHGQRPTPAKRQYAHHRIFLRPPLRSDERRRDRLGIRQSVLRQASLWRPGGLREQPGVPGIPLQRRRDRPGSSKRLTAALRQGTPHLEPAGLPMSAPNYSLWQMVQYMAKLGTIGFGGLSWMQAVFYGVGAAVIGIIAISAYRLTAKSIGKDWLLWAIYLIAAGVTVVTESEIVWIFLVSGLLAWLVRAPPKGLFGKGSTPMAALAAQLPNAAGVASVVDWPQLFQIGVFFAEAGAFVFGSGLAIVPFLYGGVVNEHHWLNERQFIDAVAVAMITPGPVVITVGFIGYLVAGLAGASVAALATFLPCYLFTVLLAPHFNKYGKRPGVVAFVDGVTAAAIGAIAGAVIVLARRTLFTDGWTP